MSEMIEIIGICIFEFIQVNNRLAFTVAIDTWKEILYVMNENVSKR